MKECRQCVRQRAHPLHRFRFLSTPREFLPGVLRGSCECRCLTLSEGKHKRHASRPSVLLSARLETKDPVQQRMRPTFSQSRSELQSRCVDAIELQASLAAAVPWANQTSVQTNARSRDEIQMIARGNLHRISLFESLLLLA